MDFFLAFFGLFSGFLMDDSAIAGGRHRGESISITPIGISTTPIGISTTPIG
jgi:hypothetical protein